MSLRKANEQLQFDVRMKDWFRKHNLLKEQDWDKHIQSLEDMESHASNFSFKEEESKKTEDEKEE